MMGVARWNVRQIALAVLILSLVAQALGAVVFMVISGFELIEQGDTEEYVAIADNIIAGHGYSAEVESPWRPTASRTPGLLLTNIPLRYLFAESEAIVTMVGKLFMLAAALCTVVVARFFLPDDWAYVAGAALTLIPAVAYYGMNPYATGPAYLFSYTAIYGGIVLVMRGKGLGALLVGAASCYSIAIRPAALFPLLALAAGSLLLGLLWSDRALRRKLWLIGAATVIGMGAMYLSWSYRNLVVFDSFQYSSVEGFNLLHFNADGMRPYLSDKGREELDASLEKLPVYIHRYHESDQMAVSNEQGEEGMRLIRKYPVPFLVSHMLGSLSSLVLFDVKQISDFHVAATYPVALIQGIITLAAFWSIIKSLRTWSGEQRAVVALMAIAGMVSVLSAGSLGQPRFRLPLEPLVAVGAAIFIKDVVMIRFHRWVVGRSSVR